MDDEKMYVWIDRITYLTANSTRYSSSVSTAPTLDFNVVILHIDRFTPFFFGRTNFDYNIIRGKLGLFRDVSSMLWCLLEKSRPQIYILESVANYFPLFSVCV